MAVGNIERIYGGLSLAFTNSKSTCKSETARLSKPQQDKGRSSYHNKDPISWQVSISFHVANFALYLVIICN